VSNPLAQFEESARTVWRSDLGGAAKGKRLKEIHSAIVHYIARMDTRRTASGLDPWTARSYDRVRAYLKHLASDVEDLSLQCERLPTKAAPKTTARTANA
jgi:hypothetical protein